MSTSRIFNGLRRNIAGKMSMKSFSRYVQKQMRDVIMNINCIKCFERLSDIDIVLLKIFTQQHYYVRLYADHARK